MATIVTRSGKGSPLTHTEVDANFENLNSDKLESGDTVASLTISSADINGGTIDGAVIGGATPAAVSGTTADFSGDVTIADKIVHSGDADTAIRFPASDTVAVETAGSERMRITSTGNVGIGTSSPAVGLHVQGPSGDGLIRIQPQSGGRAYDLRSIAGSNFTIHDASAGAERLRITPTGSVGIGTSSPSYELHVVDSGGAAQTMIETKSASDFARSGAINDLGNAVDTRIYGSTAAGSIFNNARANLAATYAVNASAYALGTNNAAPLVFGTNNTERMRITSTGNVGIGTSSPAEKLDVGGNIRVGVGFTIGRVDFNTGTINGGTNFGDLRIHTDRFRVYNAAGTQIAYNVDSAGAPTWYINGTERMRIDASGNVGIGVSSPTGTLDVASGSVATAVIRSTGTSEAALRIQNSDTGTGTNGIYLGRTSAGVNYLWTYENEPWVFATNNAERMRIDASGNLLLAKTSFTNAGAGHILSTETVDGAVHRFTRANNTGTQSHVRFITNAGSTIGSITTTTTATAYNTSSDYRLKENVVPLAGAADRLAQIPVHRFNFIADPDRTVDGFLAHEVQAFVPEAVTGEKDAVDKDGKPVHQGIDQSKLTPLITAALQEALKRIEALETEIQAMKAAGNA